MASSVRTAVTPAASVTTVPSNRRVRPRPMAGRLSAPKVVEDARLGAEVTEQQDAGEEEHRFAPVRAGYRRPPTKTRPRPATRTPAAGTASTDSDTPLRAHDGADQRDGQGAPPTTLLGGNIAEELTRGGIAAGHREMGDTVLDERISGDHESESLVPVAYRRLRVEDDVMSRGISQFKRSPHQSAASPLTARTGRWHPADPGGRRIRTMRSVARTVPWGWYPQQPAVRLKISPVELAICTALLDDEDVDPQLRDAVQRLRAESDARAT